MPQMETVARRGLHDFGVHRAGVEAALGRGLGLRAVAEELVRRGSKPLPAPGAAEIERLPLVPGRVTGAGALHRHAADGVARHVLDRCMGVHRWPLQGSLLTGR